MTDTLENIAINIRPIFEKYGIKYAGIFGSYARGEARPDSDVDILVSFGDQIFTLLDLFSFKEEISERLKKPVDIVSDRAIVPYFKEYIYRDLKPIYEQR
ncbi:MAG: nucleotidyltransferase family protein [Patescibacteria group bacterium]